MKLRIKIIIQKLITREAYKGINTKKCNRLLALKAEKEIKPNKKTTKQLNAIIKANIKHDHSPFLNTCQFHEIRWHIFCIHGR